MNIPLLVKEYRDWQESLKRCDRCAEYEAQVLRMRTNNLVWWWLNLGGEK
jgi:hypothetical protein